METVQLDEPIVTTETTFAYGKVLHALCKDVVPAEKSWDDFCGAIKHEIGAKEGSAFIAATFTTPKRADKNVDSVTALVLDVDDIPPEDVDAFLALWQQKGLAYTTARHTPKRPKFRVVLPYSRPVSPEEHAEVWEFAFRKCGWRIDRTCRNPSRLFYFPRVPDETALQSAWIKHLDGPLLDPAECVLLAPADEDEASIILASQRAEREGSRNRAGYDLARALFARGRSVTEIREAGEKFIRQCPVRDHPYTIEEYLKSIEQVEKHPPAVKAEAGDVTELFLADAFRSKCGESLRYVHAFKSWFLWDDMRWKQDTTAAVRDRLTSIVRDIKAPRLETNAKIRGALEIASTDPGVSIEAGDLDRDPWLLTVENGTVDTRTGKRWEHRREDMISKLLDVQFDPEASCPRWLRFLDEIMDGNPERIGLLRRYAGSCLTADVRDQKLLLLTGGGANGKGAFVRAIMSVIGPDLAVTAPPSLLLKQKGERHSTDIFFLRGKRIVVTHELPTGAMLDEERLKTLVGGDAITGRACHADNVSFLPSWKLIVTCNELPRSRDQSYAFQRRVVVVPFNRTFRPGEADPLLDQKLAAEREGIFAWLVAGCLEWQRDGLGTGGAAVTTRTQEYLQSQDVVGRWIAYRAEHGLPAFRVPVAGLFDDFKSWAEAEGIGAVSRDAMGKGLASHGWNPDRVRLQPGDRRLSRVWSAPVGDR